MTDKKTEYIETEKTMTELTTFDGTLGSIVQWQPQSVSIMHGLTLPPETPEEVFVAIRKLTDVYTRAKALSIDDYLNRQLTLCGCIMHMATIRNRDKGPIQKVIDQDGVVEMPSPYTSQYRQVFRVCGVDGKSCEPFFIKFAATAIEREVKETFFPRYGPGDWSTTVEVIFRPVSTSQGRTYNIQFV